MSYLGEDIGKLGFGLMRLPMLGEAVDIEQTKQMVDLFLENGFTYFDTAYGYHNGKSETVIKTALVERYPRDRYQLATKLPAWDADSAKEAHNMFWTSLERTGVEYFDYYLLHNLGGERTEIFDRFDVWTFLSEQKEKGYIKHLGFSAHAKADDLDKILSDHPEMEFVQLQINYADWDSKAIEAHKCYETARKHGKPVIIMQPVKGGALAKLPKQAAEALAQENPAASSVSWALRYAVSLKGVITVLSGMSSLDQMKENIAIVRDFSPLSESERAAIAKAQKALDDLPNVPCTDCKYCVKGCPQNVAIPGILSAMNNYLVYNDMERASMIYMWETSAAAKASACNACGKCEMICPQSIPIIEELRKAAKLFG